MDLPSLLKTAPCIKVKMFADDIKTYGIYDLSNYDEVRQALELSIKRMLDWSKMWDLPINLDKCSVMRTEGRKELITATHHKLRNIPSEKTIENLSGNLLRPSSMTSLLRTLFNPYEKEATKGQEDAIFELFKIPGKNEASIGRLLTVLKSFGLRVDDPRLKPMMRRLKQIEKQEEAKMNEAVEPEHWKLGREHFKECVAHSVDLIAQALRNNLVIPSWHTFIDEIRIIYQECAEISDGNVASYIPQLARQSPHYWGVSICTVDGQRASFGDAKTPFCVQSVSKAFNYAIAASDLGAAYVHTYVGEVTSGRLFNEICFDSRNKNSGAIIVTSLIKNTIDMVDRFDYVITQYRKIAGGEYIGFNNATFLSERATADRNYAISYYMKEKKCFPPETTSLTDALDFYFQLCSVEGNCESLSVMAATLANGGICPITEEKCINPNACRDVLTLMYSCGMYDASGQFSFAVGLPTKSGVSGVMIVVVPNVMGIALFSPPLDALGNSCRGVAFCKKLIAKFNFHNYDSLLHATSHKVDPKRRDKERNLLLRPSMWLDLKIWLRLGGLLRSTSEICRLLFTSRERRKSQKKFYV
ncbi:unnamed protein product [Cylicocyclus nassatus]|uniref:glutaminase n=1 Tax=Cylicocyclus nassatus TaxID=53992 RepID=A0AA36HCI1_CYLNA|nr:unnamed protein product [Cylicocyclus nassatus]